MGEAKFTPGEWKIRTNETMSGRWLEVYIEGAHYDDGSQLVIAELGTTHHRPHGEGRWRKKAECSEIESNARLIAASKNLLAALVAVKEYRESGLAGSSSRKAQEARGRLHDLIEAAIRKATEPTDA